MTYRMRYQYQLHYTLQSIGIKPGNALPNFQKGDSNRNGKGKLKPTLDNGQQRKSNGGCC